MPEMPHCTCNERPPSLILWPYSSPFNKHNAETHDSVEFEITGEAKGNWFKLKMYSVDMAEAIDKIPAAEKYLGGAWNFVARGE